MKNLLAVLATVVGVLSPGIAPAQGNVVPPSEHVTAAPSPVVMDPKITALLQSVQTKLSSLVSLSITASHTSAYSEPIGLSPPPGHDVSEITLLRPNYAAITTWNQILTPSDGQWHKSAQQAVEDSDGKFYWTLLSGSSTFNREKS